MRKRLLAIFPVAALACAIAGYAGGSVAHRTVDGQAPKATVRQMPSLPAAPGYKGRKFDGFGRLVFDDQKLEVECPVQTDKVGVILVTGQSNASNSAQAVFTTKYPWNVVNFFEGRCYAAASPLLGSENEKGEFITPMADALVSSGKFSHVVIVASAIGGSRVSQWASGGDLNGMIMSTLATLKDRYQVTDVVWHQGEADKVANTSERDYESSFLSFTQTLAQAGVNAPVFVAVASKCAFPGSSPWSRDNAVSRAQQALIDDRRFFLGVDSDALLSEADRRDGCHMSETGQLKVAASYANAIEAKR
jgi:hypothetical protein